MSLAGNMSDLKPKLAFSFLQRKKQLVYNPKVTSLDANNGEVTIEEKKEFITSIEDKIMHTENANYDAIPIEKFGVALLAGMGFDPKSLDSSKRYSLFLSILPHREVLLPQRPKGLGLGADPTAVQDAKQELLKSKIEKLTWDPGARCQIVLGKNKGLYGTVSEKNVSALCYFVR
ncbi:unnamed protein product [Schistosoma mattheei]|uniref:Uncharacterized protein n=1 Tax=Schistosoma mattheei TaxID=31246 RepID=A0A183PLR4_9TREM|nr:unnamed protein product [Schistosoma mattheei]